MKILAHRGYWNQDFECNSLNAIRKAMELGYGFESDVRDYKEHLVISHNIASEKSPDAEVVFEWLQEFENKLCFAINIKADGLKNIIMEYLKKYNISNYFLFDMSIPQMVEYKDLELRFFTRQSEIERFPSLYEDAAGVWMDSFGEYGWMTKALIEGHIECGKDVCIVSPELHGNKEYKMFWSYIKENVGDLDRIILCTDYPDEARKFFYEREN